MDSLSFPKRIYYTYLAWVYVITHWTTTHHFIGISLGGWWKLLWWGLLLVSWWRGWATAVAITIGSILAYTHFVYWRARRNGYSKFVPANAPLPPDSDLSPLPIETKVSLQATGVFSTAHVETHVLLQPADYWQTPLQEHAVMVEYEPARYLYQFFDAHTLQEIQQGMLLLGRTPLPTLAIRFLVTWQPQEQTIKLYLNEQYEEPEYGPPRTVYFSFTDEADRQSVLHTIVHSARQARAGKIEG